MDGNIDMQKTVPDSEKIAFTWSNVNVCTIVKSSFKIKISHCFCRKGDSTVHGKKILTDVNGVARPGEVLAILGASGSGKTTLLNVLTFRHSSRLIVSGTRCANGIPLNADSLTSKIAYVEQDDLFIGALTVREHLIFHALLRMDKDLSYKQRKYRVQEVLTELGLNDCKDTQIGIPERIKGISGGERKRLSFAAEILTNPSLMFCDEPTSGLDSFMASNVVQVLKRLAKTGKTIVYTIHQPSSELYDMFDKLLLMAEGRVAFLGTPDEAQMFFSSLGAPCPPHYNPADFFVQILAIIPGKEESCKQNVHSICDHFQKSKFAVAETATGEVDFNLNNHLLNVKALKNRYKASCVAQFRAVLWRSWISVIKEPVLIKVRLTQTILLGLIIGAIFYGQKLNHQGVMNINGALFVFITNMTFQNSFSVIDVFCAELPIFLREHNNGMYRTSVYLICKTFAETPVYVFIPATFVAICYYLIGLNPEYRRFLIAIGIVVLVSNVATSYGYFISCVSNNVTMAVSLGPPIISILLLFGGFFLNIESIPKYLKWISYVSWFRYGNEALLVNQWKGVENINCSFNADLTCPKNGDVVLNMFHFSEDNFTVDLIVLGCLICAFRLLSYFALVMKTYTFD